MSAPSPATQSDGPFRLASLHVYPIKSCAGLTREAASVDALGLAHDRRWVLTDADGRFFSGREDARLVLIRAEPDENGLRVNAPGMPELRVTVSAGDSARMSATIWKDTVDAAHPSGDADAWFSAYLGRPLHLLRFDARSRRTIDPEYAQADDQVAFADGYPLLAISQASLDDLNARLTDKAEPLSMARFRPNLVIAGTQAHDEDRWRRVRIGEVAFDAVKSCPRCVFTTVDPATGLRHPQGEPLTTLKSYRRTAKGITFGMNLIPRGTGLLRIGDAVIVEA